MYVLDDKDRALLAELQRDSRQTVQQLAAAVGLSATPCWKRVKDMEAAGVIRGYSATVDRESVGLALCVLAEVNLTQHTENTVREFERAVAACPQIVSCHSTTGAADYSIMVLVEDIKSYEAFLHDTAFKLPGVTHIRSSVVLKEVKAAAGVPIAGAARARAARARRATRQGLTNFRTNSSFGCGGSGSSRSRGSAGLRRKSPAAASRKPAASTSRRTSASSTRCSVPDSEMPVPARPGVVGDDVERRPASAPRTPPRSGARGRRPSRRSRGS